MCIVQKRLGLIESYEDYMVRRYQDAGNAGSRQADRALNDFILTARENNIPTALVMYPVLDGSIDSALGFLVDHVAEICRRNGIICIDLRPALASVDRASDLWANRFDSHPNKLANELVASQVLEHFERQWRAGLPDSGN